MRKTPRECPSTALATMEAKALVLISLAASASAFSTMPVLGDRDISISLISGNATVTGPYPDGPTSCGGDTSLVPDGFIMAAIPWSFFEQYNSDGKLGTDKGTAKCGVDCFLHSEDGQPLCFELSSTDGAQVRKVIVGDVCAGNCKTAEGTCGDDSVSCLDLPDHYGDKTYRCPPSTFVYSSTHDGADVLDLGSDVGLW